MSRLDLDRKSLRKFGITMGIAFLVITLFLLIRHKYNILPILISAVFFILAFTIPILLKPIYIIWMKLAFVLSWFNTRLILLIIFYLIFTPFGFVIKFLGKDLLDLKIEKDKPSYWRKKEGVPFKPQKYERQF
jgi:membrane-associated phospholipid phosphatase